MLEEISIKNLGVISEARLPFTKGLTVITGETGAGKTMVLTALQLLLGKRSDASIVRHGTDFVSIEGCWNVEGLKVVEDVKETGAIVEDNQLFINRTVHKDGKSRAVLGGKTTPASVLSKIGTGLVNIHGQSDQIQLKNAKAQREALDDFAGETLKKVLAEYAEKYENWKNLNRLIKDVKMNASARQREYEDLTEAVTAISAVNPVENEDVLLKQEIATLSNIDALRNSVAEALNAISSEDYDTPDPSTQLAIAVKSLSGTIEFDPIVAAAYDKAETVLASLQELTSDLSSYLDNIDGDSIQRLNDAQERLAQLNRLIRKYGTELQDVIQYWQEAEKSLTELDPENNNIEKLEQDLESSIKELNKTGDILTKMRKEAAQTLTSKVNEELEGLAMGGNKLFINITATEPNSYGKDDIAFMLKMPGTTEPRPISKSASGGELSRVMLSLQLVLAKDKTEFTYLFDEADSGVGGTTGIKIGEKLAELAKTSQVIVVSHLAQVAVFADNHLKITKNDDGSYVNSSVQVLTDETRVEEIARMASGVANSATGQEHAKELLDMAEDFKNKI